MVSKTKRCVTRKNGNLTLLYNNPFLLTFTHSLTPLCFLHSLKVSHSAVYNSKRFLTLRMNIFMSGLMCWQSGLRWWNKTSKWWSMHPQLKLRCQVYCFPNSNKMNSNRSGWTSVQWNNVVHEVKSIKFEQNLAEISG